MYNIDSKECTRVTNTTQFESETFPSIYEYNIAYSYYYVDKINGTMIYGLKIYNIDTGDETTIFIEEEPTAGSPEIFGNIIAYSENNSLSLYDLDTNDEISIYESFYLMQPWNLNGNFVLFTILDEGVYLYKYNDSPDTPIIDGTTQGNAGIEYTYTFNSEDPDGNDVYYYVMWDDGYTEVWDGPHASGADADIAHTYDKQGEFTIQAKAKDVNGAESDWAELTVKMPRDKTINNIFLRFLENFLQSHPNICPILRHLLGL
jgi:hypothetical protein